MTAPYSITGNVNGSQLTWTADTMDDIWKHWLALGKDRVVPETKEPVTGLTLWFGEKRVTKLLEPFVAPETKKGPDNAGA